MGQNPLRASCRRCRRACPCRTRTNALAVLSLVFAFLGGLLAIPFGHIALFQIKRSGERRRGMAITGLILGYLWLITLGILYGVWWTHVNYSK